MNKIRPCARSAEKEVYAKCS